MSSSLKRLLKVAVYDQFLTMVQMNHSQVKKPILVTNDEAVALNAYTKCHPPLYKEINSALRNGEHNHYLIKLIDSALNKLPLYSEEVVYRWSIPTLNEQAMFDNEESVTDMAFLSTLKKPNFLTMTEDDCWLIKINHLSGKDVALYSDDYSFDIREVLLPRGSSFTKLDSEHQDYDLCLQQVS